MVSLGPGIMNFHLKKLFVPVSSFIGEALKPNGRSFRHAFRSAISRCVAIEDMVVVCAECVVLLLLSSSSPSSSSSSSDVTLLNE